MTEKQWVQCDDPAAILTFAHGRASARKLRLYACACCRRVWHLLCDERSRDAVELAEQFADGLADAQALTGARFAAQDACHAAARVHPYLSAQVLAARAGYQAVGSGRLAPYFTGVAAAGAMRYPGAAPVGDSRLPQPSEIPITSEPAEQCRLLRDLLGHLFHSVSVRPIWLTWNDGTVGRIARAIYDERDFERLPILADALEEAGCDSAEILGHLRSPGPHVPGCWALDLILAKE